MKSVSFQPNKKIYQKNGILSGENLNNLMNQYINYSIHKRKKIKSIKNKKEENKENKEYASKKGLKQVYMENKKNLVKIMRINKNNFEEENVEDELDDNILLNKKRKPKKKHFKTYLCEFCNKAYSNGQGLGGHMSRIHPNQSYKYKEKYRNNK